MIIHQLGRFAAMALVVMTIMPMTALAQGVPVQIPPSGLISSDLTGVTWSWLRSDYNDDTSIAAADPARYTIEFHSDGTLGIGADCNRVVGTYTQQAGRLSIQLGPSTLAACPPDSQADTFLRDLSRVGAYVMDGDNLVLNMQLDTGNVVLQPQSNTGLVGVTWQLNSVNNGREAVVSALAGTQVTASFGADGSVAGSGGCNTYRGSYTLNGNSLTFGPLATTRMACAQPIMDQETAFFQALQTTATFSFESGQLWLRDANGSTQVIFAAPPVAPPRAVPVGVMWRIQYYNNGQDGLAMALPTAQANAVFGADGRVAGSTGCNNFNGPYTSSAGSAINFGLMAVTERACLSDAVNAQEQAILNAFAASTSFELLGDRMTLRSADGATQMILLRPLN
jgi:heat shock protein HslJ